MGYPLAGIGHAVALGTTSVKRMGNVFWMTAWPPSNTKLPPVFVYGGVPCWKFGAGPYHPWYTS